VVKPAFDEVLSLVGAEHLVGGDLVVVGDEHVPPVLQPELFECIGVRLDRCLWPSIVVGDGAGQQIEVPVLGNDGVDLAVELGRRLVARVGAYRPVGGRDLLRDARELLVPLCAGGVTVIEAEDVHRAQRHRVDYDRTVDVQVPGLVGLLALRAIRQGRELGFVERKGDAILEGPLLDLMMDTDVLKERIINGALAEVFKCAPTGAVSDAIITE